MAYGALPAPVFVNKKWHPGFAANRNHFLCRLKIRGQGFLANHRYSSASGLFDQIAMGLWGGDHVHDIGMSYAEQLARVAEMLWHMK